MKIKTSELTERQIDWTVATLRGRLYFAQQVIDRPMSYAYRPSTDWDLVGPILEDERIWVKERFQGVWDAYKTIPWDQRWGGTLIMTGHTYRVAALRCWIFVRAGDEIDIPEELA